MRLEKLLIERKPSYVDERQPLFGIVRFGNKHGAEIELPISEAAAQKILELCADGMIEAAGDVARMTKAQVIEELHALPRPAA